MRVMATCEIHVFFRCAHGHNTQINTSVQVLRRRVMIHFLHTEECIDISTAKGTHIHIQAHQNQTCA